MPDIEPSPSTASPAATTPDTGAIAPPVAAAPLDSPPAPPPAASEPAAAAAPPAKDVTASPTDTQGVWPDNWREIKANGDAKLLKRLQRYASPSAAIDALFAAQNRISSGELKSQLKPDATPEEKAAWRAENNIPESPDKYDTTLKDGLIFKEADKSMVDGFLKVAHDRNMRQEDVTEVLSWWGNEKQLAEQAAAEQAHEARISAEVALRQEFGPEYNRNINIANNFLASIPGEARKRIVTAKTADGLHLGNDPDFIRWAVQQARIIDPVGVVVPGASGNAAVAIDVEMEGIRKLMGDHQSEYWKGPTAPRMQARYAELLRAKASM